MQKRLITLGYTLMIREIENDQLSEISFHESSNDNVFSQIQESSEQYISKNKTGKMASSFG